MNKRTFPKYLLPLVLSTNGNIKKCFPRQSLANVLIRMLYKRQGIHIKQLLNYDLIALLFNQEYFMKNYTKNLLLLTLIQEAGYDLKGNLLDVGCGATPGGIAFSHYLKLIGQEPPNIMLLDKSKNQLRLAKRFCVQNDVNITRILRRSFSFKQKQYDSLVLFSYFICEQDYSFITKLLRNRESFKNGFIVLDYQKTIEKIEHVSHCFDNCSIQHFCCKYVLPLSLRNILKEKELLVSGCYYIPADY